MGSEWGWMGKNYGNGEWNDLGRRCVLMKFDMMEREWKIVIEVEWSCLELWSGNIDSFFFKFFKA